jgi:hypothetical protein
MSHHAQQASQRGDKQQHRELWPAYNPNLAPLQAASEGLFQQTRLDFNFCRFEPECLAVELRQFVDRAWRPATSTP